MTPRVLEFATLPNYSPPWLGVPDSEFLTSVNYTWTAKPYLEVTYTKFPEPMRPGYQLRCYERQYEQSLPRFVFDLTDGTRVHQPAPARITSRLLSYPTKIYLWGEQADDTKGAFIDGGCRRSCTLDNIHCRINQRSSVIDSPSQEDLFEMFQRHTNSDLEYGTWRKSPIYCFSPADLGQPDLHANDARLTWFEWDAAVSLTDLQIREQQDKQWAELMDRSGYQVAYETASWTPDYQAWPNTWSATVPSVHINSRITTRYTNTNATPSITVSRTYIDSSDLDKAPMRPVRMGQDLTGQAFVPVAQRNAVTGVQIPKISDMDVRITGVTATTQQFQGLIFAQVNINPADAGFGVVNHDAIFWVPQTTALGDMPNIAAPGASMINPFSQLRQNVQYTTDANGHVVDAYPSVASPPAIIPWQGEYRTTLARYTNGENVGTTYANRAHGTRRALPGPVAYQCMSAGILNCNAARTAAAAALQRGQGNYDEIDETASNYRWCAFSIDQDIWDGNSHDGHVQNHIRPIRTQADQVAGQKIWSGRGIQQINYTTTAEYGTVNNANNGVGANNDTRINFSDYGGAATYGAGWVRQLPLLIPVDRERAKKIIPIEYQMKVLYEFGNCQYEFVRGATPVRVRPNLVPVGPSPGLPQLE